MAECIHIFPAPAKQAARFAKYAVRKKPLSFKEFCKKELGLKKKMAKNSPFIKNNKVPTLRMPIKFERGILKMKWKPDRAPDKNLVVNIYDEKGKVVEYPGFDIFLNKVGPVNAVREVCINGIPANTYFVRGVRVESFSRKRGWYFPKHPRKRDNPVSLLRDLLIRAGKYPTNPEERAGWDKTLGELYLYADGKVSGCFIDRRIPLYEPGEWPLKRGKK
jgi:hypothetical protein